MKFNYQLRRVCGAYYGRPLETTSSSNGTTVSTQWSGSNVLFYTPSSSSSSSSSSAASTTQKDTTKSTTYLISAVLNRIQIIDLSSVTVRTLGVEARSNIGSMAVSPVAPLLLVVDTHNYLLLVHITKSIVLHRSRLSSSSNSSDSGGAVPPQFSPTTGRYVAMAVGGNQLQIWTIPSILTTTSSSSSSTSHPPDDDASIHDYAPLVRHRTYTTVSSITHIEWSRDESIILAACANGSLVLYTVHTIDKSYQPMTLLGHKSSVVGAYYRSGSFSSSSSSSSSFSSTITSISMDGAVVVWTGRPTTTTTAAATEETIDAPPPPDDDDDDQEQLDAVDFFTGGRIPSPPPVHHANKRLKRDRDDTTRTAAQDLVQCQYTVTDRMYLSQECVQGTTVTSTSYCASSHNGNSDQGTLAIGFSSGVFGIYEMPQCVNVHTLSVGHGQRIQTCVLLPPAGAWLALACPISQQLLVWEWPSETYILKQRGHAYGMSCMAYSPDAICIATGGEDGKIKLWNSHTGFCYVTFSTESSHTAAITGITFANDSVVLTCSLDGTVKAHDLHRYRTFKTYTSPTPVQFLCLAVDSHGEIVVAGSNDPFHIYVWNIQTGQLLDVFTGHTGPICDLQFLSGVGILVSGSWDGTVRTWDIYKGTSSSNSNTNQMTTESYQHTSDVICIAVSPNKKQICSSTMNGLLSFWNIEDHKLLYEIDGRYDISGGRKVNDRRTADTNMSTKYFTSVTYTPDSTCIIAGGNSKYICIYEISQQILLKKFQLSYNRSIDGILDELNSKNLADGGPLPTRTNDMLMDATTYNASTLPGAKRGDDGSMLLKGMEVRTRQIVFASTGREWGVISEEGLHIYSLDDDMIFDPISTLEQEVITPATIEHKLSLREYSAALRMALYLNEYHIIQNVLDQIPYGSIEFVCRSIHHDATANPNKKKNSTLHHQPLEILLQVISTMIDESPHIEFYIQWSLVLLQLNGYMIECHRVHYLRVLRALHKAIVSKRTDVYAICNDNKYLLEFIEQHASLMKQIKQEEEEPRGEQHNVA